MGKGSWRDAGRARAPRRADARRDRVQPRTDRQKHRRRRSCRLRGRRGRARRGRRRPARPAICAGRGPEPRARSAGCDAADRPQSPDGDAHGCRRTAGRRLLRRGGESRGANHVGRARRAASALCGNGGAGMRAHAGRRRPARDGRASPQGLAQPGTPAAGSRAGPACRVSSAGVVQRAHAAGGARRLCRPQRGPGQAPGPLRRRRAPGVGPRHRRHRQDAARRALRVGLARPVPGRRLVLRSVAGPEPGRHRACGCAGARPAPGQGRPGDADRATPSPAAATAWSSSTTSSRSRAMPRRRWAGG